MLIIMPHPSERGQLMMAFLVYPQKNKVYGGIAS